MRTILGMAMLSLVAAGGLAGCSTGTANKPVNPIYMGLAEEGITYTCPDGSVFTVFYDPLGREARVDTASKMYQPSFKDQDGSTYVYGGDTNGADVQLVVENGDTAMLDVDGRSFGKCVAPYHGMAMASAS